MSTPYVYLIIHRETNQIRKAVRNLDDANKWLARKPRNERSEYKIEPYVRRYYTD